MSQSGNIIRPAVIGLQHIRRQFRVDSGTKGSALFPFTNLTIQMVILENTLRQFPDARRKAAETCQNQLHRIGEIVIFIRLHHRPINIVTAQLFHAQPASF